uniref:CRAL-TRIO domain-containing protein n=1 Tax=Globodera pallida TaxID=36090 RepID=A0A183BU99_GLOPA
MPQVDCIPVAVPATVHSHHHHIDGPPKSKNDGLRRKSSRGLCPVTEDALQMEKVAELRKTLGEELLQETALFSDNYSLIRWLTGWNNKIDDIVPRFRRAASVFRCMRLNHFVIEDIDELNEFSRRISAGSEYYPGGVLGYDREGNVVSLQCMGQSHPKHLAKCGRVSDLIKMQERKRRRKLGLKVIIDLEGFNTDHLSTMALKVYGNILATMQELFPDLLRQVYVINAHYLVKTAYNIIKPVLSEQSREKVIFLGSDFQPVLARDIGPENLFTRWGGSRSPVRGHPEGGTLRMGGVPPENLKYCSTNNADHIDDEELVKLNVPARQRREVEVDVPNDGPHTIHWLFHSNGDLGFGVLRSDNDAEVWPMFHLLTDYVPEYGNVQVDGGVRYKLVFDNAGGTFFSREVKYGWRIKKVEEGEGKREHGEKEADKIDEDRDGGVERRNGVRDAEEEKENKVRDAEGKAKD